MPVINVQMLSGRSAVQKKSFIEEVATVAMRTLGVPEQAVNQAIFSALSKIKCRCALTSVIADMFCRGSPPYHDGIKIHS